MTYVDGFVIAVPTDKREDYRKIALLAADVFKSHGALQVVEAWGDDVPEGEVTSFTMAVKREANESVVFSWITWPDKATRDAGMKASMEDPQLQASMESCPFDPKRMIYGGFEVIVQR